MDYKAFRWYGGKFRMLHILRFLIPEHVKYCEPFMGSAALLINHRRSQIEVINDMDKDLVCFMQTLADEEKGKVLIKRLFNLEYSKEVFEKAVECKKKNYEGMSDIDRAEAVYVQITQSFNTTRKGFSSGAYRDTYDYRQDIRLNIPVVHKRLRNVQITNGDGIDLLRQISDDETAFAFCDPPYRAVLRGKGADRVYGCELPEEEQVRLLNTIKNAKCKIMLCGYKSEDGVDMYDEYLLPCGWHCYKLCEIVKSAQNKKKKDMAQEYIWVNYELPKDAKYVISMKEYRTV